MLRQVSLWVMLPGIVAIFLVLLVLSLVSSSVDESWLTESLLLYGGLAVNVGLYLWAALVLL